MNEPHIVILYHDDNDGYGARYAAWKAFGEKAEYHAVQYKRPIPEFKVTQDTEIYILDFSFPRDIIEAWNQECAKVVVIDHHKTAIQTLQGLPYAVLDASHSGAVLAWNYFIGGDVPDVIRLVEDYDLYTFKLLNTRAFDAGLAHHPGVRTVEFWDSLINNRSVFEDVLNRGRVIHDAAVDRIKSYVRSGKCRRIKYEGANTLLFNTPSEIDLHHEIAQRELGLNFTISYFINNLGQVIFSFRGNKIVNYDVEHIAVKLGGGGHVTSAGASLEFEEGMAFLKELYQS